MKEKTFLGRTFYEWTGSVHVHSGYSHDCDLEAAELVEEAIRAKLDYVCITDHGTDEIKDDPALPDADSDPLFIVGAEVNDAGKLHHYLVFGHEELNNLDAMPDYVEAYRRQGALGFVAHPREKRRSKRYPRYEWPSEIPEGVHGLEIWNFVSSWIGNMNPRLNGLFHALFPGYWVKTPLRRNMRLWQRYVNEGRHLAAIGSVDAHGFPYRIGRLNFRLLPHRYLFKTIRTNLWLPTPERSVQALLQAMAQGNSYIINYKVGLPWAFWCGVSNGDDPSLIPGESGPLHRESSFWYYLPLPAKVRLMRNGKRIATNWGHRGVFRLNKPGAYRLEISRWGFGWIYTNHVFLQPPETE